MKVHYGTDNQVRSAEIKTRNGIKQRPAVKIAVLNVEGQPTNLVTTQKQFIGISIEKRPPKRQAEEAFLSWGKRQKIDIEKVKSLRDKLLNESPKLKKPMKTRIRPCTWAKAICTTMAIMSTITPSNSLKISPIKEEGLFFAHSGTCLIKRGTWTTIMDTNINPADDRALINQIHDNISRALQATRVYLQDDLLNELEYVMNQSHYNAIREITAISRQARSKGLFGFLKDIVFGSNDFEDEITSFKNIEHMKHQELTNAIYENKQKTQQITQQYEKKLSSLQNGLQRMNQMFSTKNADHVLQRLRETALLSQQLTLGIIEQYRQLRTHPLTEPERIEMISRIDKKLPAGLKILRNPIATRFVIPTDPSSKNTLKLSINNVVITEESFEILTVIAIPTPTSRIIFTVSNPSIAVNHREQYFYPGSEMTKFNDTYFISSQPTLLYAMDCTSAAVFHKRANTTCPVHQLENSYQEVFELHEPNSFLYYTQNPKDILIHCQDNTITPPHYAALVHLDPECELRTKKGITYTGISAKSILAGATYFKPKFSIPNLVEELANQSASNEATHPPINEAPTIPDHHHHVAILLTTITAALTITIIGGAIYYVCTKRRHELTLNTSRLATTPQPRPRKGPFPKPDLKTTTYEEHEI